MYNDYIWHYALLRYQTPITLFFESSNRIDYCVYSSYAFGLVNGFILTFAQVQTEDVIRVENTAIESAFILILTVD